MIKSIVQIFSAHVVAKAIGLLTFIIIIEFLSLEQFGKYSYFLIVLNLMGVIVDPFTASYLVDFKTESFKKYNLGIFSISLILLPVFYGVLYFLKLPLNVEVFMLFGFTFLMSVMLKSFLNTYESFLNYGLIDVFRQISIFFSTITYFCIYENYDYIFLLKVNYSIAFLTMLLLVPIYINKDFIFFDVSFSTLKNLFYKSRYLIFYTAFIPIFSFLDSYFVSKSLTERDLGLYSFSLKVYNMSLMLVVPMFTVLNIKQIEIVKKNAYAFYVKEKVRKVLLFSTCIFILFLVANYILLNYVYIDYKESIINTTILLFGSYITYSSLPFSFLIAYKKYKVLFTIAVLAIGINILLNTLFIEKYGTVIAATSTLLSQIIINLGSVIASFIIFKSIKK
ncbi:hypothetical protein [Tenacibaculum sp. C7A-26P2]|uniref:hypothetical protein n=1 Tax=Tenacibaculum sp. C7A-26P2 TaxID=3447504 RepID=UPI003F8302CA